jgi:tetratricopeptide (TPR) repeat protein
MELENFVLNCNKLAMDHLRFKNFKECLTLLQSANSAISDSVEKAGKGEKPKVDHLTAVTSNNLGCYYKKLGKFKEALHHLYNGLQKNPETVEEKLQASGTYQNICVILSKLRRHDVALDNAEKALEILSDVYKTNPRHPGVA